MKTIRVAAAVIISEGKILATQRGYGPYKDGWEFSGGKLEPGETPQAALIREIREEMTAEIRIRDFLTHVEYEYPEFHLSMDCFLCEIAAGKIVLLEHENARWLTLEELKEGTGAGAVAWLPADQEAVRALLQRGIE